MSPEILKKIQEIKIRTRRVMNGALVGGHVTKQKGSGFEFEQLRAYSYGDDIRFVDWNSSARTGKLLVRQYLDEKNRTIMLCLDVSASTMFAALQDKTSDIMQQIIAVLALVGQSEQDNIGVIFFSDVIEKIIPPSRGQKHTMHLLDTIFSYKPQQKKTNMNVLCRYLIESFTTEAAAIIVSDFITDDFETCFKQLVCKREVILVRCLDEVVKKIPQVGYVWGQDPETQATILLHLSDKDAADIQTAMNHRLQKQNEFFKKCKVDCLDISCDANFIVSLILFFKHRIAVPL